MAKKKKVEETPTRRSEITKPDIKRTWERRPDIWARDVAGIGICSCTPKCKMDPLHKKILQDYGALVLAKKRVSEIDQLKEKYFKPLRHRDRRNKIIAEMEAMAPDNPERINAQKEIDRIRKSVDSDWRSMEKIDILEDRYGWARSKIGISIQSAKGVGKTTLMALMIMHFYTLFPNSKGIVTAPKKDLLDDNLKAEMKKWIRHSQTIYGESSLLTQLVNIDSEKMYSTMEDRKQMGSTQFCAFRTANLSAPKEVQKETLQGYHEDYMLLGCDEASGVPDIVFEPLVTTLTRMCNIIVLIFNPNKNTGFAIETQPTESGSARKYSDMFLTYRVSALDSTIITADHIDNMRKFYEDDENGWRVNVLGLPPTDDEDALIPYSKIMEARDRQTPESLYKGLTTVGGFDVGAGGDPSAIAKVQGYKCHGFAMDKSSIDDEIVNFAVNTIANQGIEAVAVDGIGLGKFMPKILRGYHIMTRAIDGRNKATDSKFYNMRAQLFWALREWILEGGDIPEDKELIKELAILKIDRSSGKIQIISKTKLKKDGHKSTNKADALSYAMSFKQELTLKQIAQAAEKKRCSYKEKYRLQNVKSWLSR